MKSRLFPVLFPALLLAAGCASQPPVKTVVKAQPKQPSVAQAQQPTSKKPAPGTGTATYAIENGGGNFREESTLPSFHAEPMIPAGPAGQATQVVPSPGAALIPEPQTSVLPPVGNTADAGGMMPVNITLEDVPIPPGTSPAVVALVNEADLSRKRGDLNTALQIMERALRIDPRNPIITYKLAQIRFKQNKIQQAEELASKAALLAGGNLELKRKSLMLINEARRMERLNPGLRDAKEKVGNLLGH
jgi:tetratricopeptide (TPR) repeat protein